MASKTIDMRVIEAASRVIKTLGHPIRLRILEQLEGRERTVGELVEALGLKQAIASQQLVKLRRLGIVAARRNGTSVYYRIANRRVLKILGCIRGCSVRDFI